MARRRGPVPRHHGSEHPLGVQLDAVTTERARRVPGAGVCHRLCPVHRRDVRLDVPHGRPHQEDLRSGHPGRDFHRPGCGAVRWPVHPLPVPGDRVRARRAGGELRHRL